MTQIAVAESQKPPQPQAGGGGYSYEPARSFEFYPEYKSTYYPGYTDYIINQSLKKIESSVEQDALGAIVAELQKKSNSELGQLILSSDLCRSIDCRGRPPETIKWYVQFIYQAQVDENSFQNTKAAKWSAWLTGGSFLVAIGSLIVSFVSFRRSSRTENATAAK